MTLKIANKINSEIKQGKHLVLVHFCWAHDAHSKGVPPISDYSERVLPFQVNAATIDGITPLFNACCSGSVACVNMLLEFGAKPQLGSHLASPIHEAVKRGNVQGGSEGNSNSMHSLPLCPQKNTNKQQKKKPVYSMNKYAWLIPISSASLIVSRCILLCSTKIKWWLFFTTQVTESAWRSFWPTRLTLTKKTCSMGHLSMWLARTRGRTVSRSCWSLVCLQIGAGRELGWCEPAQLITLGFLSNTNITEISARDIWTAWICETTEISPVFRKNLGFPYWKTIVTETYLRPSEYESKTEFVF